MITYDDQYGTWKHKGKSYHTFVDFKFLTAMGVDVIMHLPWQIGLLMEGLAGKFLWYPTAGTLVYDNTKSGGGFTRVGQKGDYPASAKPSMPKARAYVTELVYERMKEQLELESHDGVDISITEGQS